MITIARFSKAEDAHLFRLRLEAGGMPAYILDENTVQMDWLYSNAIGGIRVQISEEDIDDARELLRDMEIPKEDPGNPACPKCSSPRTITADFAIRMSFLSILLLGFPCLFSNVRWKCPDCANTWK